ncbi:MAG: hypothetical protein K0R92_2496 [Lachnospiraceae bacterium]|jgi:DUF438 domain-containing protein|nr:hypothetical protein [Lachnospiraceae bacterium]
MSEYINNREHRQQVIKQVIAQLHEGKTVEEVKAQFEDAFAGVSASEISEAEGALIAEGLPITEVQRLCDVHAAVFKGSIEEIHQPTDQTMIPGHPANTLKRENREIEKIIETQIRPYLANLSKKDSHQAITKGLERLADIHVHYQRKENLLFPFMEQYGITAPPKVMWGVDDEIRAQLKEVRMLLGDSNAENEVLPGKLDELLNKVTEMIFKEENILLPMLMEHLTQDEWKSIADESGEIGFMVDKVPVWNPSKESAKVVKEEKQEPGVITLPTGILKVEEAISMLDTLPFDLTFVDKDDVVKYFSQGKDRVFPRTKAIIGRNVSNCHPPASVHIVEKIVEDFKSGKKDQEDFWINMGGKYILIRYYAVRNDKKEYLGVLEVTQDIKPIQEITGEKRLVSE